MGFVDLLLSNELPSPAVEEVKILRLSEAWGKDVTIKLQAVSYSEVAEIKKMNNDDTQIHTILAGDAEGVLKKKELMDKVNAATPVELVKKIFSAGEIEDLSIKVERLSGYRKQTISDIKKNS